MAEDRPSAIRSCDREGSGDLPNELLLSANSRSAEPHARRNAVGREALRPQGRPGPDRLDHIVNRLAGHGGIALVFDQRRVSRVWQDAMQAVGGQRGHLVLQRQPSLLSLLRGGEHDQWLITETLERLRLLKGGLQFGKLVVLAAGQLCAGLGRTLLVASLWRQTAKARQVDESKHADASE